MYPELTATEFGQVHVLCPVLRKIALLCKDDGGKSYADLLCFYGPLLRFMNIYQMHSQHCERVSQSCKNVRYDLNLLSVHDGLAKMSALGPVVRKVRLRWPEMPVDEQDVAVAALTCTTLEEIVLEVDACDAASAIRGLFSQC